MPEAIHPLSHHQNDPAKLEMQTRLNTYHLRVFAGLLDKLDATPDGDGSLLDHTTVLFGSGMSNSDLHLPYDVPTLMVGGASTKGGRQVRYSRWYAAHEPPAHVARTTWRSGGAVRQQHRVTEPLVRCLAGLSHVRSSDLKVAGRPEMMIRSSETGSGGRAVSPSGIPFSWRNVRHQLAVHLQAQRARGSSTVAWSRAIFVRS